MPLFSLDSVRNATIDRRFEPLLEDVREDVITYPHWDEKVGTTNEVLEAYDLARPRLNVLLGLLEEVRGGAGADISAGLGFLPVLLHRTGIPVIATEREPSLCRFAMAHGTRVLQYTIGAEQAPFDAQSLDFLVFAEVLEHLKHVPLHVVRELSRLLRPGGKFFLTTPNVARLQHIQALAAGENFLEPFPETVPPGTDPTDFIEHVREYSIRELVEIAEAAGLGIDAVLMTGWGESGYDLLPNPYANEICVLVATR